MIRCLTGTHQNRKHEGSKRHGGSRLWGGRVLGVSMTTCPGSQAAISGECDQDLD